MSGLFGSITVKGNRLTEFAATTAAVGIPIPFGFGKFPSNGNVIFAALPPTEHVKKKKQGKGGVKTETYTYTLSYAVAFSEGPLYGFWTIRRNGKIVWTMDPEATVEDQEYADKWAEKATFYYGTKTQLPDPTIESYKGAGNVSAFRNLAYIVVEDDDVTLDGGAAPNYEAICIGLSTGYATTPPYAVEGVETFSVEADVTSGELLTILHEAYEGPDTFGVSADITGGLLGQILEVYDDQTPEVFAVEADITAGTLDEILVTYDDQLPETFGVSAAILSGELDDILITNTTTPETFGVTAAITGGTLT